MAGIILRLPDGFPEPSLDHTAVRMIHPAFYLFFTQDSLHLDSLHLPYSLSTASNMGIFFPNKMLAHLIPSW